MSFNIIHSDFETDCEDVSDEGSNDILSSEIWVGGEEEVDAEKG